MKAATNNTLSEIIQYDFVSGPQSKPLIRTQYLTNGTFVDFENDLVSRSISLSNDNRQYQVYSFMPPVKTMALSINNFEQKYSIDNTASAYSSILKKNLQIRCWSGYELTGAIGTTTNLDDFTTNTKFVHTQKIGSAIYPDQTSFSGTMSPFADLGVLYDGSSYSSTTYAYPGYYHKQFNSTFLHPKFNILNVDASSNNMAIKWRTSPLGNMTGLFTDYVTLATGSNTYSIEPPVGDKYLDYIIRFNNSEWNTADSFDNVSLSSENRAEMFKQGTFIIDDPVFVNTEIQVNGRDSLRKALETEINLPPATDENANVTISKILTRCKIDHNSGNWDNAGVNITYNPLEKTSLNNISGWKALDLVMDSINGSGDDYVFDQDENGQPIIKKILTDVEADWTAHYKYNIENLSKSENSKSQLQRATIRDTSFQVSPEATIGNFTGTSTSNGTISISYAAFAGYNSADSYVTGGTAGGQTSSQANAIFVRYINNGSASFTESARTQTGLTLISATSTPYDISVLGCAPIVKSNLTYAEKGNADNIINAKGSTYTRSNPFLPVGIMGGFVNRIMDNNGDPKKFITLDMVANPMTELRDNWMIISKYDYTDDIYGVVSITENWKNPSLKQTVTLKERGFDLGAFQWDRGLKADFDNAPVRTVNTLKWDTGFIWDQDFGPNATGDPTDYTNTKEIQFI